MQRRFGTLPVLVVVATVAIAVWFAVTRSASSPMTTRDSSRSSTRATQAAASPAAGANAPNIAAGDAAQATGPAAAPTQTIAGRVIDGATGDPIEGAEVWRATSAGETRPKKSEAHRSITNASGDFTLTLPANNALALEQDTRIAAWKKGWLATRPSQDGAQPGATSGADLTIVLIPAQVVAGRVRFADGARVLGGRIGFIRPLPIEDRYRDPLGSPKPEPDDVDPTDPFVVNAHRIDPLTGQPLGFMADPFGADDLPPTPTPPPPPDQ